MRGLIVLALLLFICQSNACKNKSKSYHRTYVANGYSETIYARVGVNKLLVTSAETCVTVGASYQGFGATLGVCDKQTFTPVEYHPGFNAIAPGSSLAFPTSGKDGRVYVSVKVGSKMPANNYVVKNDCSVKINSRGYIRSTKYGDIWDDSQGCY